MLLVSVGCGDDSDDSPADAGTEETSCSSVVITDSYEDATDTGDCTSEAGLAIANSMMNLDGLTIDNDGTTMTPCVEVQCDDEYAYIISNGIPHYDFVATTPNELAEDVSVYRIPLTPTEPAGTDAVDISTLTGCEDAYASYVAGVAPDAEPANFCTDTDTGYLTEELTTGTATYAQIVCLGKFGALLNGVNLNGPNEAGFPDPYGDPGLSYPDDSASSGAALDFCGGHTGGNMHYHTLYEPCFETDEDMKPSISYADAVLTWTQLGVLEDDCTTESPILGWSLDGHPIKGPCICLTRDNNGDCTSVKKARSSWQYEGLSSHDATPDASLALESTSCTTDDDCCPDGVGNDCDLRCNYALTADGAAGTEITKICTLLDYAWCSSVFQERTAIDTSAENFVYVDRCNGYTGADGFAYHATGSFPYLQACFRGEPAEQAAPEGGGGPGGGGPPPGG